MTNSGPSKCLIHKRDFIWVLNEWFCPDCERENEEFNKQFIGMDGPEGFQIRDLPEIGGPDDRDEVTRPMMKPIKKGMI